MCLTNKKKHSLHTHDEKDVFGSNSDVFHKEFVRCAETGYSQTFILNCSQDAKNIK